MSEPFIGQMIMVGFNFAPRGYAACDGALVSIAQNTTLFALLGTTFGGNGQTTFGLPDMRGRTPVHQGQGPGLTPRIMGEASGEEDHTLIISEMPMHNHVITAFDGEGDLPTPPNNTFAGSNQSGNNIFTNAAANTTMNPMSCGIAGGSQPHDNMQPYLVMNFCIATEGIFPPRS